MRWQSERHDANHDVATFHFNNDISAPVSMKCETEKRDTDESRQFENLFLVWE